MERAPAGELGDLGAGLTPDGGLESPVSLFTQQRRWTRWPLVPLCRLQREALAALPGSSAYQVLIALAYH